MFKANYDQIFEDFTELKKQCFEQGLLKRSYVRVWLEVAVITLLFAIGVALHESMPVLANALAAIGGITLVWWIHDAGHDAYFKSKKFSKAAIETLGLIFLGMPQIEYHYEIHRRHHGFTNVIGKDRALETGPIIWNKKMLGEKPTQAFSQQALVWFAFVLPLTWPLITLRCIKELVAKRKILRLTALSLRWVAAAYLVQFDVVFLTAPILITGFVLGFSASLNHFHMPMDDRSMAPFPASVFLTTQNLANKSKFATWLTGGLNFHIEHHLFPTVPNANLARIAPLVEEFAAKHALPYSVCSVTEATVLLTSRLQNPLEPHEHERTPLLGKSV